MNPKPRFSFTPVRRAEKAEARRAERDEGTNSGPLWEVKVTESRDYHRVGDVVIVELA